LTFVQTSLLKLVEKQKETAKTKCRGQCFYAQNKI
jgi:hypothetical protein